MSSSTLDAKSATVVTIYFVTNSGLGLGCMGLRLLHDDPDTSQIATFIKKRRVI
jgi:hypothetical protein